jgi:hypothetical protein
MASAAITAEDYSQAQDLFAIFITLRDSEYGNIVEKILKFFASTAIDELAGVKAPRTDVMDLFTTTFSELYGMLPLKPAKSSINLSVKEDMDILDFFINISAERLTKSRETDISNLYSFLFMPIEIQRDDYRNYIESVTPLTIDRLMEGRALKSKANLLRLPVELIGEVMKHIPSQSLPTFALVNSDCRQLARSRQFVEIRFDYSGKSLHLLHTLFYEAIERRQNKNTTSPSLGACVRQVVVATDREWVFQKHGLDSVSINEMFYDSRHVKVKRAAYTYSNYVSLIGAVLATALPHLESLQWFDRCIMQKTVFQSLVKSRVRHLNLHQVHIDESCEVDTGKSIWPLQSLALQMAPNIYPAPSNLTICTSLLRLCSTSLERLDWRSQLNNARHTFGLNSVDYPTFPLLRELRIQYVSSEDDTILRALLPNTGCRIRVLFVDMFHTEASKTFFSSRGRVEALNSLGLRPTGSALEEQYRFVAANPQLTQLYLQDGFPSSFIKERLTPLLRKSFILLTSLSLVWEGTEIDHESLGHISNIDSLEQLHLSSGKQSGSRHDWLINHETMRTYLARLPKLKILSFTRDSYSIGLNDWLLEEYYETYQLNEDIALLNGFLQTNALGQFNAPIQLNAPAQPNALVQPNAAPQAYAPAASMDGEDDSGLDDEDVLWGELVGDEEDQQEETVRMHGSDGESDADESDAENESDDEEEEEEEVSDADDFMNGGLKARKRKWEKEHLDRMLAHGDRYFVEFCSLEWLYLGQIPLIPTTERRAKPTGKGTRDSCSTYLSKAFWWPHGED